MADNVKKRSASHIYYGVDAKTGELRHISDVVSGLACGCVCALCKGRFEARKGELRRHHFAHESNYECMYAGEVAIYQAVADILEKAKSISIPSAQLTFPAWTRFEQIQDKKRLVLDSVKYKCENLAYPPDLFIEAQGGCIRILLDFGNYYDGYDYQRFADAAKAGDYACLAYSVPNVSEDAFFEPEHLKEFILSGKEAEWVFNRAVEYWREKFVSAAYVPEMQGARRLCPLHMEYLSGQETVSQGTCSRCAYNVAQGSGCLCLAKAGIFGRKDFSEDPEKLRAKMDAIRAKNDELIAVKKKVEEERKAREQLLLKQQMGPSQSELDEEYHRIVDSFDESSKEPLYDKYGRRWVKCSTCGIIKRDYEMTFTGFDGVNMGECRICTRNNRD